MSIKESFNNVKQSTKEFVIKHKTAIVATTVGVLAGATGFLAGEVLGFYQGNEAGMEAEAELDLEDTENTMTVMAMAVMLDPEIAGNIEKYTARINESEQAMGTKLSQGSVETIDLRQLSDECCDIMAEKERIINEQL